MKQYIRDGMLRVDLDFRIYFDVEVARLPEEVDQELAGFLYSGPTEGSLNRIVGYLDEAGVRKPTRSRELEDAEVDCRFQNEKNAKPAGLRNHLNPHIFELSSGFDGSRSLINALLDERLTCL